MHTSVLPMLACPACRRTLQPEIADADKESTVLSAGILRCMGCLATYPIEKGVARLLQRTPTLDAWLASYESLRRREGWHSDDPAFYRALPFEDLSGKNSAAWAVRASSFRKLLERLHGHFGPQPRDILDLGAGTGWLAARLAAQGHRVIALDLEAGPTGLQAARHFAIDAERLGLVQGALEEPPIAENSVDLVVFNASFHYAKERLEVLRRARALLRRGGALAIVDSPTFPSLRDRMQAEQRSARYYESQGAALLVERYHGLVFSEMMEELSSLFAEVSSEYTHTPTWKQKLLGSLRGASPSFVLFWAVL